MIISAIVAISSNYGIGLDNQLLWHLPDDFRFFKQITTGKPIIMGRKTFGSIGRPLSKRTNIILTRNEAYEQEGCEVVHSVLDAFRVIGEDVEEVCVIGGDQIYHLFMPYLNRLYVTHVSADMMEADTFFPQFLDDGWVEIFREHHPVDETHAYPFDWVVYERIDKSEQ